ncbi:MAG: hypothetical protein IID08_05910 [Candidatus Hydrogenedentes bacterium]|nr:hypothetical protein [Candidatus Hydrogenedentota bacterium]
MSNRERAIMELKDKKADLERVRTDLSRQLDKLGTKHTEAIAYIEKLRAEHKSLQTTHRATSDALTRATTESKALKKSLDERTRSLHDADKRIRSMQAKINALGPEVKELRDVELPRALEQKVEAFRKVQDLRTEVKLLRKQLW